MTDTMREEFESWAATFFDGATTEMLKSARCPEGTEAYGFEDNDKASIYLTAAYLGWKAAWEYLLSEAEQQPTPAVQGEPVASAPVAAQHRFRHPQKSLQDWSAWQPAPITLDRPSWEIDSQGFEVEYRLLYEAPQPAEQKPEVLAKGYFHPLPDENDYEFHDAENFPNGSDCPARCAELEMDNATLQRAFAQETLHREQCADEKAAVWRRCLELEAINLGLTKTLVEMEEEKAKLVEALEDIQKASTIKGIHTGAKAGLVLGRIETICYIALQAYRRGGEV